MRARAVRALRSGGAVAGGLADAVRSRSAAAVRRRSAAAVRLRSGGAVCRRLAGVLRGRSVAAVRRRSAALSHRRSVAADRGLSTIEVVILAPVMILFILVLVAFGQLVDGRGAVDSAARDAARAGSIQKDLGTALSEAKTAAEADLADVCSGPVSVRQTSAGWTDAEFFTVEVSCRIRGLSMLGLDIPTTLTGTSTSPLDPFKRKTA